MLLKIIYDKHLSDWMGLIDSISYCFFLYRPHSSLTGTIVDALGAVTTLDLFVARAMV